MADFINLIRNGAIIRIGRGVIYWCQVQSTCRALNTLELNLPLGKSRPKMIFFSIFNFYAKFIGLYQVFDHKKP